jgi:DNA-binding winged helix-turn-helix (wHTH) protein
MHLAVCARSRRWAVAAGWRARWARPAGFALLDALLSADGQAVTKDDLLASAWPGLIVEETNLSVQIAALRKALGGAPNGLEWIATVPRISYRLQHADAPEMLPRPVRPSIAVLPFENLSSDADYQYFAEGSGRRHHRRPVALQDVCRRRPELVFAFKDRSTPILDIAHA